MDNSFIKAENLNFQYGNFPVLKDISFSVGKGEIISLIGPNGSGKTTLLKLIIGVLEPSSGRVRIDGKKPLEIRSHIGYVPQKFDFDRNIPLSVREFMALNECGHRGHGRENISKKLSEVGLEKSEDKKLGELSGGQFQRVMIARALLHEKDILAFDEPLAGIDIAGGSTIYDLITRLNREKKVTTLIVSHELNVVNRYSSYVLCLNNKICCMGKPAEVLTPETIKSLYGEQAGLYRQH